MKSEAAAITKPEYTTVEFRTGKGELLVRSQAMPDDGTFGPEKEYGGPEKERSEAFGITDWADIVMRIREGDNSGMEELYGIFAKGIRYFLLRNLGADDLDDRVHDCFVIVAESIRKGDLRDPARLMGFVRTVVKRQIAANIETAVNKRRSEVEYDETMFNISDWKNDPEKSLLTRQRTEIARRVMGGISKRDREILQRFYVDEQPQEKICEEMGLTYNQFRLLKSRAKARFGDLGKRMAKGMGISFRQG
jgi:RNA polymerase sigma factor (sigma-70 family)